ncbi:MAG: AAA family ATPase, partial [Saprospiraceae bacterium]|nr:AAA family ATPase [Saprospiraceae bacterium]
MIKEFNVTGKCNANRHYMADVSHKLSDVIQLVERGKYFIINRPRQYGKTTILYNLTDALRKTGNYLVFNISFEGIDDMDLDGERTFPSGFVRLLAKNMETFDRPNAALLSALIPTVKSMNDLSDFITDLTSKTDKKVVVLIDEVDQSSNNELFVKFLAMLRNKYLARDETATFHSIVLAGLHDVKTLKLKLRPDEERKYNSPWNIATDFKVDMNLFPAEIKPML